MSERMLILWTLCGTLAAATVGIILLMLCGVNVAKEVSLYVGAQWGGLLVVYARQSKGTEQ